MKYSTREDNLGVKPASELDPVTDDEAEIHKDIERAHRKHASKRVDNKTSAKKKKA